MYPVVRKYIIDQKWKLLNQIILKTIYQALKTNNHFCVFPISPLTNPEAYYIIVP